MTDSDIRECLERHGLESGSVLTEYVAGKLEYEERTGSLMARVVNLTRLVFVALVGLVIALVVIGLLVVRRQPVIAFGFAVDKAGHAQSLGTPVIGSSSFAENVKQHALESWVSDARMVISDWPAQRQIIRRVLDETEGSANQFVRDWYTNNRPDLRAKEATVTLDINSTLKLAGSQDTYEVEWTEKKYAPNGERLADEHWKGDFTIDLRPAAQSGADSSNPLGFYVSEIHWSQQR